MPTKFCPHCGKRTGFQVKFNVVCRIGDEEEKSYGAMHLTPPATTCSMWRWRIIREHWLSLKSDLLPTMTASDIWHRFVGQTGFAAPDAGIVNHGRQNAGFVNAGNVGARLR